MRRAMMVAVYGRRTTQAFGSVDRDALLRAVRMRGSEQIPAVADVACGWGHTAVLAEGGGVFVAGRPYDFASTLRSINLDRQLGALLRVIRWVASRVFQEDVSLQRHLLPDGEVAVEVCTGRGALTVVRTASGAVYCMGDNLHGQCGAGQPSGTVMSFVRARIPRAGESSEASIAAAAEPQLPPMSDAPAALAIAITPSTSADSVAEPGTDADPLDLAPRASGDIVSIAAGMQHVIAVDTTGAVWAWGKNGRGELGTGDRDTRFIPALVIQPPAAVASKNATEPERAGQANMEDMIGIHESGRTSPIRRVWAGFSHSAALDEAGIVWVWGRLHSSVLPAPGERPGVAHDALEPRAVPLPDGMLAIDAACGQAFTAILGADGSIYMIGMRGRGLEHDATTAELSRGSPMMDAPDPLLDSLEIMADPIRICTHPQLLAATGAATATATTETTTITDSITQLTAGVHHVYAVFASGAVVRVGWRGTPERVAPLEALCVRRLSLGFCHAAAVVEDNLDASEPPPHHNEDLLLARFLMT